MKVAVTTLLGSAIVVATATATMVGTLNTQNNRAELTACERPTTGLFTVAVLAAGAVLSGMPSLAPVPNSRGEIRSFIEKAVDRVVDEQPANQSWTVQEKASYATRYYQAFTAGTTLTDGDLVDIWAEHVQFTKQYRRHVAYLQYSWEDIAPAKFKDDAAMSHQLQVAGKTILLPGMNDVAANQGWTPHQLDQAVQGYGQFLRAIVSNSQRTRSQRHRLAPSLVVDEIWHQHIRYGLKYSQMCESALLGRFLHHAPHETEADRKAGPSSYAHTLGLIEGAGEELDNWVWPSIVTSDDCSQPRCSDCQPSSCGGGCGGCGEDL